MLKKNKLKVILSTLVILLPIVFGLMMWNDLPDMIMTHWGADGNADGMGGKSFLVFGIPVIFFACHLLTLILTSLDKRQKDQTPKALGIIFWILPMISLCVNVVMYNVALDGKIDLGMFIPAFLGVAFILMGNYMPKVRQNSSLGIKVSWALQNEENWNKTHRFGGKLMVLLGFVMILSALLPIKLTIIVFVTVIVIYAIAPVLYSYLIYKKHREEGIAYVSSAKSQGEKVVGIVTAIVVPIILIAVAIIMFTGNIEVSLEETSFKIDVTYWTDIDVDYAEIEAVSYRSDLDLGVRASGFGSAKLSMGMFQNDEFGAYTLYAYNGAKEYVVLTSGEKTLVIGMNDPKETKKIYDTIVNKIGK